MEHGNGNGGTSPDPRLLVAFDSADADWAQRSAIDLIGLATRTDLGSTDLLKFQIEVAHVMVAGLTRHRPGSDRAADPIIALGVLLTHAAASAANDALSVENDAAYFAAAAAGQPPPTSDKSPEDYVAQLNERLTRLRGLLTRYRNLML